MDESLDGGHGSGRREGRRDRRVPVHRLSVRRDLSLVGGGHNRSRRVEDGPGSRVILSEHNVVQQDNTTEMKLSVKIAETACRKVLNAIANFSKLQMPNAKPGGGDRPLLERGRRLHGPREAVVAVVLAAVQRVLTLEPASPSSRLLNERRPVQRVLRRGHVRHHHPVRGQLVPRPTEAAEVEPVLEGVLVLLILLAVYGLIPGG